MFSLNAESPERRTLGNQEQTAETTRESFSYTLVVVNRARKKAIPRDMWRCLSCWREMLDAHVCTFCSCIECGKTTCGCRAGAHYE